MIEWRQLLCATMQNMGGFVAVVRTLLSEEWIRSLAE